MQLRLPLAVFQVWTLRYSYQCINVILDFCFHIHASNPWIPLILKFQTLCIEVKISYCWIYSHNKYFGPLLGSRKLLQLRCWRPDTHCIFCLGKLTGSNLYIDTLRWTCELCGLWTCGTVISVVVGGEGEHYATLRRVAVLSSMRCQFILSLVYQSSSSNMHLWTFVGLGMLGLPCESGQD